MRLIDQGRFVHVERGVSPGIGDRIVLYLAAPALGDPVLGDAACIERNVLRQPVAVSDDGEHTAAVMERIAGEMHFPVAVFDTGKGGCRPLPAVKITRQIELVRTRCPLTVDPSVLLSMEAVPQMCFGKTDQFFLFPEDLPALLLIEIHAKIQVSLKGAQFRHFFYNWKHHSSPSLTLLLYWFLCQGEQQFHHFFH